MKRNRQAAVLLIVIMALLTGIIIFLSIRSPQKKNQPVSEAGGPGTVVIDNTDNLSKILLTEQYTAVSNELVNYIQSEISNKINHAKILGSNVQPDGTVVFSVKTDQIKSQFTVVIDRKTYWDKIIFMIPASKFSETLQVY